MSSQNGIDMLSCLLRRSDHRDEAQGDWRVALRAAASSPPLSTSEQRLQRSLRSLVRDPDE